MRLFSVIFVMIICGCDDPNTCKTGWDIFFDRVEQECPEVVGINGWGNVEEMCVDHNECASSDNTKTVEAYLKADPTVFCAEVELLQAEYEECAQAPVIPIDQYYCYSKMAAIIDRVQADQCSQAIFQTFDASQEEVCHDNYDCSHPLMGDAKAALAQVEGSLFCGMAADLLLDYQFCVNQ